MQMKSKENEKCNNCNNVEHQTRRECRFKSKGFKTLVECIFSDWVCTWWHKVYLLNSMLMVGLFSLARSMHVSNVLLSACLGSGIAIFMSKNDHVLQMWYLHHRMLANNVLFAIFFFWIVILHSISALLNLNIKWLGTQNLPESKRHSA